MKFQEYVPNANKISEAAGNYANDNDNHFFQNEEDKLSLNA